VAGFANAGDNARRRLDWVDIALAQESAELYEIDAALPRLDLGDPAMGNPEALGQFALR